MYMVPFTRTDQNSRLYRLPGASTLSTGTKRSRDHCISDPVRNALQKHTKWIHMRSAYQRSSLERLAGVAWRRLVEHLRMGSFLRSVTCPHTRARLSKCSQYHTAFVISSSGLCLGAISTDRLHALLLSRDGTWQHSHTHTHTHTTRMKTLTKIKFQ